MDAGVVHEWVAGLVGLDPAGSDRAGLETAAAVVRRLRNWLDGRETAIAGALAGVVSFPQKNLAEAGQMSLRHADRVVDRATNLQTTAPLFAEALDRGRVSGAHVDTYQRIAGQLPAHTRERFTAMQAGHTAIAEQSTADDFARTLRRDAERLMSETDRDARLVRQKSQVRLKTWVDRSSGMGHWHATWDPETMLTLDTMIIALTERLHHGPTPEHCPDDPIDRQAFLRAHALLTALNSGGVTLAAPQAVIVIHSNEHGHAVIDYDLPLDLPARVTDQLLARADIRAVVINNGHIISAPGKLNLHRNARCANHDQRMAIRALYNTCAIPNCRVHVRHCEAHHVNLDWNHGGPTNLDNLAPVCKHHHDLIHNQHWVLHMAPDRTLTITLPDHTTITTGPPTLNGP
jgi:hypothetical protein